MKQIITISIIICLLIFPRIVHATPYNIIDIETNSIIDIDNIIDIDKVSIIDIDGIIDIVTKKIIDIDGIIDDGIIDIDNNSIIDIEGNHIIDIDGIIDIEGNKLDVGAVQIIDIEGNSLVPNEIGIFDTQSNMTILDNDLMKSDVDYKTIILIEYFGNFEIPISSQAVPIPEPTTMLLLGSGLIGLAGFRRRLKRQRKSVA